MITLGANNPEGEDPCNFKMAPALHQSPLIEISISQDIISQAHPMQHVSDARNMILMAYRTYSTS